MSKSDDTSDPTDESQSEADSRSDHPAGKLLREDPTLEELAETGEPAPAFTKPVGHLINGDLIHWQDEWWEIIGMILSKTDILIDIRNQNGRTVKGEFALHEKFPLPTVRPRAGNPAESDS